MSLRRTTDAATEPISTTEAKAHLRVTGSTDDTLIDTLVKAARQMAENELSRSLITQTWTKTLDAFPDAIELAYPPIISVTSVKYLDADGVLQTLDPTLYTLDSRSEPGYIVPVYGGSWPSTLCSINAVEAVYVAGYGAAAAVPQAIKQWILLQVGNLYENREATMPGISITPLPFIGGLLDPYRIIVGL